MKKYLFILLASLPLYVLGQKSYSNPPKPTIKAVLNLKGQVRLDELLLRRTTFWDFQDSTIALTEMNIVKQFAKKTDDELLSIYVDFLSVIYDRGINPDKTELGYKTLKRMQEKVKKMPHSDLQERFYADIEHTLGLFLYFNNKDKSRELIEHYLKADLYYRKQGYENIIFADYKLYLIGLFYYDVADDVETALNYLREAEKYIKKDLLDKYRINLYKTIANCLVREKQFSEAIKYNKLAIAQVRFKQDSLKVGTIGGNIGEIILNHFPNPIDAEPYFKTELQYRLKYKPKGINDIAKVYGNMCQVEALKGNRSEMVRFYAKALETLKPYPNEVDKNNIKMSIYKNRMIADSILGDYKNAYYHQKLFYEQTSLVYAQDIKKNTTIVSVQFDVERNKLKADLATQQAQNSRFWVLIVSLLLFIALGGGYYFVHRQRQKKEALAQQLFFEQKQAEKLAEINNLKTRFFTNISHEFRTPLTLLVGPIEDLKHKYPNEGIIAVMQRNLQRLQSLINQLLDLSKLEAGEMKTNLQEVDLANYLDQLFSSFESLAQSKNIIFNHSQSHLSQLGRFDLDKLEKIITNLLSNAFKFTPENGRIKIRIEYIEKQIVVKIQDSGMGISSERLPHIFDRFYQVDDSSQRQHEGTGIGLSLVKELVDLLGGQIDVSSKVDEGTTFILTLPFEPLNEIKNPSSHFVAKNSPDAVLNGISKINGHKIDENGQAIMLIVEDNSDLRNYIASIFENQYQLVLAVDGEDGLSKVIEFVPDIVISDLMMPKLDGLSFCEQLKNDDRINHIPVIMLTAKASLSDRLVGLEKGADDYLSKPFNKEELVLRVSNLINQRQLLREKYAVQSIEILPELVIKKEPTIDELFIQKAKSIIEKYLDKSDFDVEKFANEMNLSSVQLRRKLKAITNQTVTEFVRNYRLEIAAELLKKGEGTVSEIAYKVGFDSLPYFSKVFQEKYEKVASEWK